MSIQQIVDFAQASTPAEHYSPEPETLVAGNPEQSLRNHYSSPCEKFSAGVWESAVGQWQVDYTEHEYIEILQGVLVLRDEEGNAKTVSAGDRLVVPAGFKGTLEVLEPVRKVYVVFETAAA